MNQARLAWAAFKNMLRAAARDPVWALTALVLAPFRAIRPIAQAIVLLGLVILVVGLGGALALDAIGFSEGSIPMMALDIILPLILILPLFRLITNPLIIHFEKTDGHTHGSARVASDKEVAPLTRSSSGLLIERDGKTGKLLRYDGPAHLLTTAPTRTGKGVGTIIPNLLTADRSVICIDPEGENARMPDAPARGSGLSISSNRLALPGHRLLPSARSTCSIHLASMSRKMLARLPMLWCSMNPVRRAKRTGMKKLRRSSPA